MCLHQFVCMRNKCNRLMRYHSSCQFHFIFLLYIQVVLVYCGQYVGSGSFLKLQLYIHELHPKSEKKSKMQLAVQDRGISRHMFRGAAFWHHHVIIYLFIYFTNFVRLPFGCNIWLNSCIFYWLIGVWAIILTHGTSVFCYFTITNQLPTYMKTILHYDIKSVCKRE